MFSGLKSLVLRATIAGGIASVVVPGSGQLQSLDIIHIDVNQGDATLVKSPDRKSVV